MTTPEVSHGRGGAGNINPDDTKYVDGEITRQGEEGSHGDGAFSTGRGGKFFFSLFFTNSSTIIYNIGRIEQGLSYIYLPTHNTNHPPPKTGAANIADADKPTAPRRSDAELVPEEAVRTSTDNESFHVGRGGAANVHLSPAEQAQKADKQHAKAVDAPPHGATPNQSLADKLKHKIFGRFKK